MPLSPTVAVAIAGGAVGLAVLVVASRVAVGKAVAVARAAGVAEEVVAVSVIAVGTSLPEIAAHLTASAGILSGTLDPTVAAATVLGGNMGSSTTQQLLLVGVFLVGYGRLEPSDALVRTTYLPMLLAFALVLAVAWDRTLSRLDGVVMVGAYLAYLYYTYDRRPRTTMLAEEGGPHPLRDAAVGVAALLAVVASAYLVLEAVEVAVAALALNTSMVGVLTLGLAAALPELSAVVESLRRRAHAIALGTLLGSNLVNVLLAAGLGAAASTYVVPPSVVLWDLPFKLGVGVAGVASLRSSGGEVGRTEGMALVVLYFLFLAGRFLLFPG